MGIFNDLGFKNRNGVLVAPDSEKIGGLTATELMAESLPTNIVDPTLNQILEFNGASWVNTDLLIPNATSTTVGGIKATLSGTTLTINF